MEFPNYCLSVSLEPFLLLLILVFHRSILLSLDLAWWLTRLEHLQIYSFLTSLKLLSWHQQQGTWSRGLNPCISAFLNIDLLVAHSLLCLSWRVLPVPQIQQNLKKNGVFLLERVLFCLGLRVFESLSSLETFVVHPQERSEIFCFRDLVFKNVQPTFLLKVGSKINELREVWMSKYFRQVVVTQANVGKEKQKLYCKWIASQRLPLVELDCCRLTLSSDALL